MRRNLLVKNGLKRSFVALLLCPLLFALAAGSCDRQRADTKEKQPAVRTSVPVFHDAAFGVLAEEIKKTAGDSETYRAVRETGLLKVALDCNRLPMCTMNEYGVSRGFEVDLLRRVASLFGAKLNIVSPGEEAHLSGPVVVTATRGVTATKAYFYSADTGRLCFHVQDGDRNFADTVDLVISHLYETGTYQQLYRNWFKTGNIEFEAD